MGKKSSSAAARAIKEGKRKPYLMGWVAAIEHSDGSEWTLNHDGNRSGAWAKASSRDSTKIHPTKESALAMAREHKARGGRFPVYIRSYAYETPDVKTAEKFCVLPLQDFVLTKEFV